MSRTDAPVSFTMPVELKSRFVSLAKKNQRSITQELIIAVREHIARDDCSGEAGVSQTDLHEIIKDTILEMKKEKII